MFEAIARGTNVQIAGRKPMRGRWTLTTWETILFIAAVMLMAGGSALIVGY
jgi:hypothetical protein